MKIGKTLIDLRREHNYSQQQFADLLDVSQSTVCDWEGDISFSRTENLLKIAELYQVGLDELLPSQQTNIINSPNANAVNNSSNFKIETSEALLQIAKNLEKLIEIIGKNNNSN